MVFAVLAFHSARQRVDVYIAKNLDEVIWEIVAEGTSCTIITEPSAGPVSQIHDRQPLILDPAYYDAWLDPKTPAGDLKDILSHDIDGQLQFYRVGREVNAAAINKQPNDYAGLIEPIKLL